MQKKPGDILRKLQVYKGEMGFMDKITIAVIGVGRIGKMHTENLVREFSDVQVKAVASPIINKQWAKRLSIPIATTDVESIFEDGDIDAVIIAASSTSHVDLIKSAASARKAIFCEKPIAFDPERIAAAVKAVKDAGVILQVGFNRRFDTDFLAVKHAVENGEIGVPHLIKITNRDPKRPDLNFVARSGGMFIDFNVHDFDMARFITNSEIQEIYATGDVLIDPALKELNDIDTAIITLRMQNGTLCVIDSSRETHYGYDQRLEAFGDKGAIQAPNRTATKTRLIKATGVISDKPLYSFVERYQQAYIDQFKEFFDCVRERRQPSVTGTDALKAVQAALTAKLSFTEHRMIEVTG